MNQSKIFSPRGLYDMIAVKPFKDSSTPQPPANFVRTLRKNGIKVRVRHFRRVYIRNQWAPGTFYPWGGPVLDHVTSQTRKRYHIDCHGGRTEVDITLQDGRTSTGSANCSVSDNYNKRVGVYLAASRALKSLKQEKKPSDIPGDTPSCVEVTSSEQMEKNFLQNSKSAFDSP